MNNLDLRTILSVFATALVFGCMPVAETQTPELPEGEDTDDEEPADVAVDEPVVGDDDDSNSGDDDDAPSDPCHDMFEDNDLLEGPAHVHAGSSTGLTLCEDDDDYYAIELAAGDHLTVQVDFLDEEGDADLQLMTTDGVQLDASSSVTDSERVEAGTDEAVTWIVRVFLHGDAGEAGQDYDLTITVGDSPEEETEEELEPPAPCAPDAFAGNQTQASAVQVTAGSYADLTVCDDSEDWFAIDTQAGQTLTVDLLFDNTEGDIDLRLFDPSGLYTNSMSVTDDEALTYVDTVAGTYFIRAWLWGDSGTIDGNDYDLVVTLQ